MKHSVNSYNQFLKLAEKHFHSFNCNRLSASRESLLSFIPRLSQFTEIEISSVFVYHFPSRKISCCRIFFATPLLTCSPRFTSQSICMTSSALLGFLSKLSSTHSFKAHFYDV